MSSEEARAWLRLLMCPGLGPVAVRRLLAALGSPQAVVRADVQVLSQLVPQREAQALAHPDAALEQQLDEQWARTQAWLSDGADRALISLGDAAYPARLLDLADPPLLLFAEGDLSLLAAPSVAVVGSRHATAQGVDNARAFAQALSAAGVTVVSGLARGIDAAAHEGALEGQLLLAPAGRPGGTVAVVGTGLDVVYPKGHTALARRIAARGLMLSEFPLGTPPLRGNFPKRNRLVAALARGTLVVEAAVQSGSLITARLAAEQGREVFAIPGSIHAPQARGCHALIRQGAKLVESAQDILEDLRFTSSAATEPGTPSVEASCTTEDELLRAMGHDPVSLDALQARTGMTTAHLQARLLELELSGDVARLPGGLLQRQAQG